MSDKKPGKSGSAGATGCIEGFRMRNIASFEWRWDGIRWGYSERDGAVLFQLDDSTCSASVLMYVESLSDAIHITRNVTKYIQQEGDKEAACGGAEEAK